MSYPGLGQQPGAGTPPTTGAAAGGTGTYVQGAVPVQYGTIWYWGDPKHPGSIMPTAANPTGSAYGPGGPFGYPPVYSTTPLKVPETTQPPATQPPATKPPATQPPATQPPATQPPATQPPATQPPATQPPVTQPPYVPPKDWGTAPVLPTAGSTSAPPAWGAAPPPLAPSTFGSAPTLQAGTASGLSQALGQGIGGPIQQQESPLVGAIRRAAGGGFQPIQSMQGAAFAGASPTQKKPTFGTGFAAAAPVSETDQNKNRWLVANGLF